MAFPATMKCALSISLSVGAILSGFSRSNWKCELSLEAPGQGVFVTYISRCRLQLSKAQCFND